MAVSVEKRLLTVEEYHEMGRVGILGPSDHVELIHGEIIKMSPIGSKHAAVVDKLSAEIKSLLKHKSIIRVQSPIVLGDLSEPVPDISILQWKEDYYASRLPGASDIRLIIEVAGSSMEYDRSIKLNYYASAGIPEYWIVDLDSDGVEQYQHPENGIYQEKIIPSDHDSITSNLLSGQVAIADLLI